MGSPVVANLYMERFEMNVLNTHDKKPMLWLRYIDDTLVIWQRITQVSRTPKCTTQKHPVHNGYEKGGLVPFLDVIIKRKSNGKLGHAVYRKSTRTDQYLNANWHHHPSQKAT
ncbi:uncharacterized protein [Hetaerina americana]|uniref:uncharacterized protein n=1 Tax=Hetaerina americana TaxID=62018 RepID=UPI003A7F3C39